MFSIANVLLTPIDLFKKRFRQRRLNSSACEFPPTIDRVESREFGPYCVKVTVDARDKTGNIDKTFIGYSQNMNITQRTELACEIHKTEGTKCQDPVMVIKSGNADEVIFMKMKNRKDLIRLTNP